MKENSLKKLSSVFDADTKRLDMPNTYGKRFTPEKKKNGRILKKFIFDYILLYSMEKVTFDSICGVSTKHT